MSPPEAATCPLPTLVAHADWSISAQKRWMATAVRQPDGRFSCSPPQPVGEPGSLFDGLRASAGEGGCALAGFDFPIGLPVAYAQQANIARFLDVLPLLGKGEWSDFFSPATVPGEICLHRPFYPAHPGGSRHQHLVEALGVNSIDDLRRRCERAHQTRRAASPPLLDPGRPAGGQSRHLGLA